MKRPRYPDLPPGNPFDAIIRTAAQMRAQQIANAALARQMRAARESARRSAVIDLQRITPAG